MKKTVQDYGNKVSYRVEFNLEERELMAVNRFWHDFTFYLKRGEGWGVIPEEGFGGVAWVDNKPAPGGRFRDGIWKGVIYPNGRPDIPNINDSVDILYETAIESLMPVMQTLEAFESLQE